MIIFLSTKLTYQLTKNIIIVRVPFVQFCYDYYLLQLFQSIAVVSEMHGKFDRPYDVVALPCLTITVVLDSPWFVVVIIVFDCSQVLRPGESTTFEIVFLPRAVGLVEDMLLIQSSFGTYKYKVLTDLVCFIFCWNNYVR